ncbi:MAG: hypothetical protein L0219_09065 [Phycisphaerales bacterium]|nr:hypothetical protein [Phycisphaerales bacterium]
MKSHRSSAIAFAIVTLSASQAHAQWFTNGAKVYYNSGNVGIGTSNPAHKLDVRSSGNRAISAQATATTGLRYGVWGQSKSDAGVGVLGLASALSGVTYGIYGKAASPDGYAGYFEGDCAVTGYVGIGTDDPQAKLHIAGTPGVDGIQFPDGTVQTTAPVAPAPHTSAFINGSGNNPTATTQFVSSVATITVTAGQKVLVQADKAFGSTAAGGADSLDLWIGYRVAGSGAVPTTVGGGIFGLRVPQNTRFTFGMSAIISGLAPGTYEVGLAGRDTTSPENWNSNEWSYVTALGF